MRRALKKRENVPRFISHTRTIDFQPGKFLSSKASWSVGEQIRLRFICELYGCGLSPQLNDGIFTEVSGSFTARPLEFRGKIPISRSLTLINANANRYDATFLGWNQEPLLRFDITECRNIGRVATGGKVNLSRKLYFRWKLFLFRDPINEWKLCSPRLEFAYLPPTPAFRDIKFTYLDNNLNNQLGDH